MFDFYRLLVIALGGLLIGALLDPISLSAEQRIEHKPQLLEQSEGVVAKAPIPETKQIIAPPSKIPSPAPSSLSPSIKNQGAPEETCGERCQASEQREKDDLVAQQSMARSTGELLGITFWQTVVGSFGLMALLATIVYTHKTYRLTARTSQQELRAYVGIIEMTLDDPGSFHCRVQYKNSGQTPAYRLTSWTAWKTGEGINFVDQTEDCKTGPTRDLAPGVGGSLTIPIEFESPELMDSVLNKRSVQLYVWGGFRYIDAFGEVRTTKFRARLALSHENTMPGRMLLACQEGNEST